MRTRDAKPDAPSGDVAHIDEWMARGDDEDVLWSGRPRLPTVVPSVLAGLLLLVVGISGAVTQDQPALFSLALVGLTVPVGAYLRVVATRFVVTDYALYRKTGVLSRRVERIALRRVQNSAFTQGVLGSTFDYGTVSVEAAGGGTIAFTDIDDPQDVRALVERRVDGDDVPGSLEQWTAVRDEVRAMRRAFDTEAP